MTEPKRITAITINHRLLSKDVRRRLKNDSAEKQGCFVCGGYGLITECHHVVHVNEIARAMHGGFVEPPLSVPIVWLCPNHHRIIHLLDQKNDNAFELLSKQELVAVDEISQSRRLWWEKLYGGIKK